MNMKRITFVLALCLAMLGCKKEQQPIDPSQGNGQLKLALSASDETFEIETKAGETPMVTPSDFSVDITDADGESVAKYDSYTDMPDALNIEAGEYTIEAKNGNLISAAFDSPWFYGKTDATVKVGKATQASVECKINNVKLTIDYTEKFLSKLKDVKVTASSIYDNSNPASPKSGILYYDVEETRAGWFAQPYNGVITIYITGVNVSNGREVSLSTSISEVEARQWRKVTLDVKTSGDIFVDIVIDETVLEMPDTNIVVPDNNDILDNNGDNGNWEGGDPEVDPDPDPKELPSITGSAFGAEGSSEAFDIDEVVEFNLNDDKVLDILIASEAEGGIGNLFLTIESDVLTEFLESDILQIYGEIDLANPDTDAAWYSMFQDPMIGIIDAENPIAGKSEHIFSVGALMQLLGGLPGASGASHKFILRVVDANGETSKTLTIALSGTIG